MAKVSNVLGVDVFVPVSPFRISGLVGGSSWFKSLASFIVDFEATEAAGTLDPFCSVSRKMEYGGVWIVFVDGFQPMDPRIEASHFPSVFVDMTRLRVGIDSVSITPIR